MRRLALVLLAATPLSVLAQSMSADLATMNLAQCTGTQNAVRGGDDALEVGLTWSTKLVTDSSGNTTGTATGTLYRLYAGNMPFSVDPKDGDPCTKTTSSGTMTSGAVGDFSSTQQVISAKRGFSLRDIAARAGHSGCADADSGQTIYLCMQWIDQNNGNKVVGYAIGSNLTTDFVAPGAPTGATTRPGDGVLHVDCAGGTDNSSFKALAQSTDATDSGPHWSSEASSCGDLKISGLVNGVSYAVQVWGLDDARNPSATAASTTGSPIQTDDYWNHYDGQEKGGCATAAGAAGLAGALAALLALAALRRRNS